MKKKENLYKAINYMSYIQLTFNTSLLKFLFNEGDYLINMDIDKLTISEKYQRVVQIEVAKTYLKNPFYVPLQTDWRGRIYTKSFFANYAQSGW
jgi:hypothetical protein